MKFFRKPFVYAPFCTSIPHIHIAYQPYTSQEKPTILKSEV